MAILACWAAEAPGEEQAECIRQKSESPEICMSSEFYQAERDGQLNPPSPMKMMSA